MKVCAYRGGEGLRPETYIYILYLYIYTREYHKSYRAESYNTYQVPGMRDSDEYILRTTIPPLYKDLLE